MAQIVKSTTGHWVGKELYKGSQYFGFGEEVIHHPIEDIVEVDYATILLDFQNYLGVLISDETSESIIRMLAIELCNSELGIIYLQDYRAKFGVRKILNLTVTDKTS